MPFHSFRHAAPHVSFVMLMLFFSMYGRVLLSPLLVYLQQDLGVGPARATRLFLTISLAYSPVMLLSGFLGGRLVHRQTIALSSAVIGLGLIVIALAPTLVWMHVGAALAGAGAGLYPPAGVAAVTGIVRDEIRGKALALHEVGPNLAFVVAPIIVSVATLGVHWRWIPGVSGVAALVAAGLFDRRSIAGGFRGAPPHLHNVTAILRKGEFWAILVFFSLAAASTMGVFSIMPTYLVTTRGYPVALVNGVISASRISGLVVVFLSGILLDWIGVRRLMITVIGLTGLLTIAVGLLSGTPLLIAVLIQPLIIVAFFPAAVSAMADLGPPEMRNVAVSVMIPGVNIFAAGFFPALMGYLTEIGAVGAGFVGLGTVMLLSLVLTRLLDR